MKRLPVILALLFSTAVQAHPDPAHTLAEIDRHLAETPDDPVLLVRKGELLLRGGQTDLAMNVVSDGLRKSCGETGLLLLHARILEARGDRNAAFLEVSGITRDHPSFPEAWSDLARMHEDAGRHDEAITAKLRHLETDGHPSPGDFLTASAWLKNRGSGNDNVTAIGILDRGIAAYPSLTGLQQAAIQLECEAGRFDSALERVSKLVSVNRPSVRFSLLRVGIFEAAGRHQEAADACDSALALLEIESPVSDTSMHGKIALRKQENLDRTRRR